MSRKNVYRSVLLVLISWASLVVPASAQEFKQVKGTLFGISAGRNEVFAFDIHTNVYRYHAVTGTTGSFAKVANVKFFQIAVGGGTLSQFDEVWGIEQNLNLYRFNYSTKVFDQIPSNSIEQIAVGEGTQDSCHPYEVWGVNPSGQIYRYNYCTVAFDEISGALTQVATGGGDVWGLNSAGAIFHFNFASQTFKSVSGTLTQISVGVNDVWGVNSSNNVFRYDPKTGLMNNVGGNTVQVSAGGDGVWIIDTSSQIWHFDSSSESFVKVPGNLKTLSSGFGAGVFGINSSDAVFTFVRP